MGRVDKDILWEKGDARIVEEQAERHLFCCWFILHHKKHFDVVKLVQRVRVLADYRELFSLWPE